MNVPMTWLRQYVPIDMDLKTFMDGMTMSGSKVEKVEESGKEITKVVVGKIIGEEKHPDADRLRVLRVDIGSNEPIQIVTAATNVQVDDIVPVALDGATLANGVVIKKGNLRGVESNGMLCSIEELGLTREQFPDAPDNGIYIFSTQLELGSCVKSYFGLGEQVIEFEITSNRSDCFSILGIAREVSATFDVPLTTPKIVVEELRDSSKPIKVTIHNETLCPRFATKVLRNVKVGPSPKWLQDRLISAGLRPINNIVDITNFVLVEYGQPMHAFDYDKIAGNHLHIRNARDGEKLVTLMGDEITLDKTMIVVADNEKVLSVGGVMGGESSKVTEETTTIVFECANFNGYNIRQTSKKLGIISDSSKKFVKGIDPNIVEKALGRACQLVNMVEAGEVVSGLVDIYPRVRYSLKIKYDIEWINSFLGLNLCEEEMTDIFKRLKFGVDTKEKSVVIPTYRPDITMMADLSEEIVRIYGYDKVPVTLEQARPTVGVKSFRQLVIEKLDKIMSMNGLFGVLTYTIESPKVFDKLNIDQESVLRECLKISNPLGEDFSILRTTTLNGILNILSTNYNKRNENVRVYEIGKIFEKQYDNELPKEIEKLTIGMYGKDVDFFTLKATLETIFTELKITSQEYLPSTNLHFMHSGRCASVKIDQNYIGFLGEVHPRVLKNYGIGVRAYVMEIDIDALVENTKTEVTFKPTPKFPSISRDIAMLVMDNILVGDIEKLIQKRGGQFLESIELFDVYKGQQIEEDHKSVAYNLVFRSNEKTLTDEEVQEVMAKIVNGLETSFGAKLRD
ncbi:phenylalanine--tRNA ligase subunit beta [Candidatus Epulonipiscium fishelsonii]|uniref:Phenylalanine--tRNA ligase subunit beta n=1 Tax=Candidatus Epulonipiscium fishelsonii TaxID=77094 RepID=A0ACC8XD25_9FIRM|nr:phenylalanine--tRNA ligase subunit beta [Epulopiscium sp. SCG-B11WGA-EpuloA1]ONI41785.1 phenylalanine--tRNA ligase subunit beta [Epulopiscium sp. SCG-B05WGA-EpuloA1]